MSWPGLVARLPEGPVDVVGDVHGEIDALTSLLERLGYDRRGGHPEGRHLVFVGDLVDRGPDSPSVLDLVRELVERGRAFCVLGNHELNLLREAEKHGNRWWWGRPELIASRSEHCFDSVPLESSERRERFRGFLLRLPLALERDDLRVVHACWHPAAVEDARRFEGPALDLFRRCEKRAEVRLAALARVAEPRRRLLDRRLVDKEAGPPDFEDELARWDTAWQMSNPVNVLVSGEEGPEPNRQPFWSSGKWRFVERLRWWEHYRGPPVVVGHYWRRYDPSLPSSPEKEGSDLFGDTAPDAWLEGSRHVYCIDFSVGRRYLERIRRGAAPPDGFRGCLAALRWPEREVVADDGRPALRLPPPTAG